jgi:hypothetical protein
VPEPVAFVQRQRLADQLAAVGEEIGEGAGRFEVGVDEEERAGHALQIM